MKVGSVCEGRISVCAVGSLSILLEVSVVKPGRAVPGRSQEQITGTELDRGAQPLHWVGGTPKSLANKSVAACLRA